MTEISPDEILLWEWGMVRITATLAFTWLVMAVMGVGAWLMTRRLHARPSPSRPQVALEMTVTTFRSQVSEIAPWDRPDRYLPFVGTLFLFIVVSNLLSIFPGFIPPTASLSTTTALAICVFVAVPVYGVSTRGFRAYFASYLEPSPLMLPFNILAEITRTLALAVRLFGNMMSATTVVAILLAIAPFILPIPFRALGLFTGLIQAYIFSILAMVYVAAGTRRSEANTLRKETHG